MRLVKQLLARGVDPPAEMQFKSYHANCKVEARPDGTTAVWRVRSDGAYDTALAMPELRSGRHEYLVLGGHGAAFRVGVATASIGKRADPRDSPHFGGLYLYDGSPHGDMPKKNSQ